MSDIPLHRHVEALIFCASAPLSSSEIHDCMVERFGESVSKEDIEQAIASLERHYRQDAYSFEITHTGGGYQMMTKPDYQESVSLLLKQQSKKRLSKSALETLSIIAYKQPATKLQIEQVRGVSCDYAIRKLLEKGIVEIKGKSDGVGRPVLYGTSQKFLEYFGINHINELPTPKDFKEEDVELNSN